MAAFLWHYLGQFCKNCWEDKLSLRTPATFCTILNTFRYSLKKCKTPSATFAA